MMKLVSFSQSVILHWHIPPHNVTLSGSSLVSSKPSAGTMRLVSPQDFELYKLQATTQGREIPRFDYYIVQMADPMCESTAVISVLRITVLENKKLKISPTILDLATVSEGDVALQLAKRFPTVTGLYCIQGDGLAKYLIIKKDNIV